MSSVSVNNEMFSLMMITDLGVGGGWLLIIIVFMTKLKVYLFQRKQVVYRITCVLRLTYIWDNILEKDVFNFLKRCANLWDRNLQHLKKHVHYTNEQAVKVELLSKWGDTENQSTEELDQGQRHLHEDSVILGWAKGPPLILDAGQNHI